MTPSYSNGGHETARRRPASRGSVILLVLMTLLLTAFALTKYLEKTTIDLLADARAARADRLRSEAYSALETVIGVLNEFRTVDSALRSPTEGWGAPLEFAGYTPPSGLEVEVTLDDESGKISLPHVDYTILRDLFIHFGEKQTDAEMYADALLVWMEKEYEPTNSFSARAADYEREQIIHDPPVRSLHSFAELASIKLIREKFFDEEGHPNDLWRKFVDAVSLYDFGAPNINAARESTLAAFGGYDDTSIKMLSDYILGQGSYIRQGPSYFRSTKEVAGIVGQQVVSAKLGTAVSCLRITVTVKEGQASFRVSAVVAPPGGAGAPPATPSTASSSSESSAAGVDSTSTNTNSSTTTSTTTTSSTTTSSSSSSTQTSLNYPFTLLEVEENGATAQPAPAAQPTSA